MDVLFRIEMLGRFRVCQGNREITRFRTQKTASLLARLALYPSRSHLRDVLTELFWHNYGLKAARANLSVALTSLRRQLEPPGVPAGTVLIADHAKVGLNPLAFTTDVEDFESTLREAELETEAATRLVYRIRAIELYQGDLLPDSYEDWVLTERDRLRDAYVAALRLTVKESAELRQPDQAIAYAHRLVNADPFREESHRILMRLLMAVGRPHDALHQFQELERLLLNEWQTRPSAATQELAAQLHHVPSTPRKAAKSVPFQKEEFANDAPPAVKTQSAAQRIPPQFTRFFGREEEIARIAEWIHPATQPPCPLVTLTGPGGTGKTRLSIEAAGRVKEAFPDSFWFVPLAEVHDPLRLGETLRDALELPRQTHSLVLEQVIAFLRGLERPSLLILDNFEQITAGGAPLIWTLLSRVPLLRCLVTSRQPLSLPGEREFPLLPLPVPAGRKSEATATPGDDASPVASLQNALDLAELMRFPSVALFVDRAQTVRPEFQITPRNAEAIATLCAKLEGIPLAIELAAARAKALTPAQMLQRLSERFELLASRRTDKGDRHRSLWAAMDWSYHLLPPNLQQFFARLSVFHGGWTLEAAEALCAAETTGQNLTPLDALAQLRGHSLIQIEENLETMRFRMLETVREFAAEQIPAAERDAIERCHAGYFARWVTEAQLIGAERTVWFERFEEDFDNLRALLSWSLKTDEIERGLLTANTLMSFWQLRGHLSEGRTWYARLLERGGETPMPCLGNALHGAGTLAYLQGDFPPALALLERCMQFAEAAGDETLRGSALQTLGSVAYFQGDYEQSRLYFGKSLEQARLQGAAIRIAGVLGNLANVAQACGDFATSRRLNEESLKIWREEGDRNGEARTLHNLANLAHSQGQLMEARSHLNQSLVIKRELGDRYAINGTLIGLADVTMDMGEFATAAAYARESLGIARELGGRMDLVNIAYLLINLVRAIGEADAAARMYRAQEIIREEMNYPLPPVEREEYQQVQTALRESLGDAGYEAARDEGRLLTLKSLLLLVEETLTRHSL